MDSTLLVTSPCRGTSVQVRDFLLPIDLNIVLEEPLLRAELLLYPSDQMDRDAKRRESSALIMPVSRLAKNGFRYGMHAVMMLKACTNCEHITTDHVVNVKSSDPAMRFRKTSSQIMAPTTLSQVLALRSISALKLTGCAH